MIQKKWLVGIFTMMLLGGSILFTSNVNAHDKEDDYIDRTYRAYLEKEATITREQSIEIAQREVPGTLIRSELDRDDGRVVYEVIMNHNQGEIYEISIDAKSGVVIEIDHED
jgi:uncharacterized membrane protein YkoI